jgi:hypothetical protein
LRKRKGSRYAAALFYARFCQEQTSGILFAKQPDFGAKNKLPFKTNHLAETEFLFQGVSNAW